MPIHIGSCHCGQVRFAVDADIDHVRMCDCSVCTKRGALTFRVEQKQLELLTPWEKPSVYTRGSRTATDYFCGTCGILTFRRPRDPTARERRDGLRPFEGWAVNVLYTEWIRFRAPGGRLREHANVAESNDHELLEAPCKAILTALSEIEIALVAARRVAQQEAPQFDVQVKMQNVLRLVECRDCAGAADPVAVMDAQRSLFEAQESGVWHRRVSNACRQP